MQGLTRKQKKILTAVQKRLLSIQEETNPEYLSYEIPGGNALSYYVNQLETIISRIENIKDEDFRNLELLSIHLKGIFLVMRLIDTMQAKGELPDEIRKGRDSVFEKIKMLSSKFQSYGYG